MSNTVTFHSNWISPPGDTIADILKEKNITLEEFSEHLELSVDEINLLIKGQSKITNRIAHQLNSILGSSKDFWIKRENNYRKALNKFIEVNSDWFNAMPISDMKSFGWLPKQNNRNITLINCLSLFNVSNSDEWYKKHESLLKFAAFKTSESFDGKLESIVTWLTIGKISSNFANCSGWDPSKLENNIPKIKQLTRIKEPSQFIPKLKKYLEESGVALSITPTPKGCHASAAVIFENNTPVIILSFRYKTDDHLWFSIFHELGHLLLHGDRNFFLETKQEKNSGIEKEANEFALNTLIPEEYHEELFSLSTKNWKGILKLARRLSISPGIVLGQLQRNGIVDYRYLNKMKVRYKWTNI